MSDFYYCKCKNKMNIIQFCTKLFCNCNIVHNEHSYYYLNNNMIIQYVFKSNSVYIYQVNLSILRKIENVIFDILNSSYEEKQQFFERIESNTIFI